MYLHHDAVYLLCSNAKLKTRSREDNAAIAAQSAPTPSILVGTKIKIGGSEKGEHDK